MPLCCKNGHRLHAWLQERHLVDVVQAFPALRLPLPRLLDHLRQLQPRLYSISSSQLENPARVQVSVSCCSLQSAPRHCQRRSLTSRPFSRRSLFTQHGGPHVLLQALPSMVIKLYLT